MAFLCDIKKRDIRIVGIFNYYEISGPDSDEIILGKPDDKSPSISKNPDSNDFTIATSTMKPREWAGKCGSPKMLLEF